MKVHEYQAKGFFKRYQIPVPEGDVATTPQEARAIAEQAGGRVVVKAQVHAGGRGKAGGIKLVNSSAEAEQAAASMLGTRLVTEQTGPEGVPISKVLVEAASAIERELYLGVAIDGSTRAPVIIASEAGGVEIEEVAASTPEKVLQERVDPIVGYQPYIGRNLAYAMRLDDSLVRPFATLAGNLYNAFITEDASLAEINPLIVTADGQLLALDAKLNLEDDALFRHGPSRDLRDQEQEDPLESEAEQYDLSYVNLDGDVGCMVNGAGLAMATMDLTRAAGAEPANFLDVGGGADEAKISNAFRLIVADPRVKRVFINIFGGILRCDVAARGIVQEAQRLNTTVPIVVRMRGTNAEEGLQILADSGVKVEIAQDLKDSIEKLRSV